MFHAQLIPPGAFDFPFESTLSVENLTLNLWIRAPASLVVIHYRCFASRVIRDFGLVLGVDIDFTHHDIVHVTSRLLDGNVVAILLKNVVKKAKLLDRHLALTCTDSKFGFGVKVAVDDIASAFLVVS